MNGNLTMPSHQAALDYYLKALNSYHDLLDSDILQNLQQSIDLAKNLEIPLNIKIAECYL